jgi:leucyl aminopeptidase
MSALYAPPVSRPDVGLVVRFIATNDWQRLEPTQRSLAERTGFGAKPGDVFAQVEDRCQILLVGVGGIETLSAEMLVKAGATAAHHLHDDELITIEVSESIQRWDGGSFHWPIQEGISFFSARLHGPKSLRIDWSSGNQPDKALILNANTSGAARAKAADWVDAPPNLLTPEKFAEEAIAWTVQWSVRHRAYSGQDLVSLGAGGLRAIGSGSSNQPVLLHLSSGPSELNPALVIVGKGITFDSGGLSLKSPDDLMAMKCDMAGAAAAIAGVAIAAQLYPTLRVDSVVALAENVVGPDGCRPGDVIETINGKRVEILNTDFEGRVVLADALSFSTSLHPKRIVDLATLTMSIVNALGRQIAGLFTENHLLANQLQAASVAGGEPLWRMPMDSRYDDQLSSEIADIRNFPADPHARNITAARFLSNFVDPSLPWAHLDIAGPAWSQRIPGQRGGTGFGVSTLSHLLTDVYQSESIEHTSRSGR